MGLKDSLPWILAVNVIALAVLYNRYSEHETVVRIRNKVTDTITHALYPKLRPLEHGHVCGLLPLDWCVNVFLGPILRTVFMSSSASLILMRS